MTPGGNTLASLACSGRAAGAAVALSCGAINFGAVAVGQQSTRVLHVENAGSLPAGWQLLADGGGVFAFDRTQVCVNRNQVCVNRTQVCVNRNQVCVNPTQVCVLTVLRCVC